MHAAMTELREPHEVVARADGRLAAILQNSAVMTYFIPIECAEIGGDLFPSIDAVIDALKSSGKTP